jgi:hypothetical protein
MISDAEIRFRLLTHFYALRHNAGGWVPAGDIILSPDPVPIHVVGGVCEQLADVELIRWKPHPAGGGSAGMAKITGEGVAAIEARRCEKIEIRFPPEAAPVGASSPIGELSLQDEPGAAVANLEWIRAADASRLLKPAFGNETMARMTICKRAHAGFIRARAEHYEEGTSLKRANFDVPMEFWWARGEAALQQNWIAGDFETWINQRTHLKAFGVSFARPDIETLVPASIAAPSFVAQLHAASANNVPEPKLQPAKGGRLPADWWENLLIEICFQHFRGDLKPKTQADILRAMQEWITAHGHDAAESTVKIRARKVWQAITREAGN